MSALEYAATVANGQLSAGAQKALSAALRKLEGKRVVVSVREWKPVRSGQQNRYYWGVVVRLVTEMFREAGNYVDDEEVHEFLKLHVGKLAQVIVGPDGEVLKTLGSTKKLTTAEFSDYVERIKAWAAGYGLEIPSPNEQV